MQKSWSFVAMQYYAIVLNRTYLVTVHDDHIEALVCRDATAAVGGGDVLTRHITSLLAVHGDLDNPASYVDQELLKRTHKAKFSIPLSDVESVFYDSRKKWGMGPYPHDGRVFLATSNTTRELIILGDQSGRDIAQRLASAARRANSSFKPTPLRGAA